MLEISSGSLLRPSVIELLLSCYELFIMPASEEAVALKQKGNKAFASHEWLNAIDFYEQAIKAYAEDPSFYCNKAQVKRPIELFALPNLS